MSDLDRVLAHIDADLPNALERLFALLRIPSISTDSAYKGEVQKAAKHLAADLATIGFKSDVRPTPGHPVVVGHAKNGKGPHFLFYGHYDVQPVDPLALWEYPPFEPRVVEIEKGRKVIRARGACDDKGQVMTFVEACRAYKAVTGKLPASLSLMIEGEEELGSANLPAFVEKNRKEFAADLALVCDTGQWDRTTPAISTSLRGMLYEEVIVRAADRDLHSGGFGGAAANPIRILAKAIAALHDKNGRIMVPRFYQGVKELPPDVLKQWKKLKLTAAEFLGQVGLSAPAGEKGRLVIEQISSRPTCDVNGIWGGYTGEGTKTVIAAEARAKISFRLVGEQDPEAIQKNFRAFIEKHIPKDCSVEFIGHANTRASSLPWDMPALAKAKKALSEEWGKPAVLIGQGGSIPIVGDFKRTLGLDCLLVGFGLDDDRLHSPNEKYDLSSFHKGTRSWARILHALTQ